MDPVLIGGLNFTGLLRFQDCLAEWGIRTPNDLAYFNEWDFCSLGMTRLESRKLLSLSAVAAMLPQTTTYPAPEQQIDVTAGMRNVHELAAAVTEAEGFAYSSLNTSLEIAERLLVWETWRNMQGARQVAGVVPRHVEVRSAFQVDHLRKGYLRKVGN